MKDIFQGRGFWSYGFTLLVAVLLLGIVQVSAQGNSISGTVMGVGRHPVVDIHVELRDEFSRTLQRARTGAGGRYSFAGLAAGRFKVAVIPYDLPYEEQEQDVEIISFARPASGGTLTSGLSSEVVDVYLKVKQGATLGPNGTIFAQDVPAKARDLYEKAITELDNKHEAAAYESLKQALEIFPKYYAALSRLGTEYVKHSHFEAAAILLALATEVNPDSYSSWYGLAYAKYSLNRLEGASTAIAKALTVSPASIEALILSGSIMRSTGKFKEAEAQLLKAKELSKDGSPRVHWELALLYGNDLKRYADAASELRIFLKMQPDSKDSERINKLIADFDQKAQKI